MITSHHLRKLTPASFFVIPALATERGQAIARLCWAPLFAIYLYLNDKWAGTPQYAAAWTLTAVHFVFAVAIWQLNRKDVGTVHQRRAPAAFLDQALIAALLYLTDEIAAPLVLMPLLLTFGSGLRYGRTYAVYISALSSTLTCGVLLSSPYWIKFPAIQVGLAIGTIVLPLYIYRLTDALALGMRTDSMTRLRNRIGFDELLYYVTHCAAKANHASAVVLLDLDGFKQINDVHGHDGGDLVLKHVAYWLSIELSPFGVPARFGGDEFAVIVNKVTDREALEAALTRFLKRTADVGQLFDSALGASIGVYYIEPASCTTARLAYKAADQLMYRAKKLGKNQLVASTNRHFSETGALVDHPVLTEANENTASALTSP